MAHVLRIDDADHAALNRLSRRLNASPRGVLKAALLAYASSLRASGVPARQLYSLAPAEVIECVHDVLLHGVTHAGRSPMDWRTNGKTVDRIAEGIARHTLAMDGGEFRDPKSGQPHRAHVIARHIMALDIELREHDDTVRTRMPKPGGRT